MRPRVLAWPLYTYPGLPLADSGYICFRNLIRAIPEWDWQLIVPRWAYEGGELADDLDDMPNVQKVPADLGPGHREQEVMLPPQTVWDYAPQEGVRPVDFAICGSNQIALVLVNTWKIRMLEKERPLVIAWDLMTRDDEGHGWHANEVELLTHFTGAAAADLNVYGSEMMRWMTERMVRKQFSPAVVRDVVQNRSETVYAGVPTERILKTVEGIPKRDRFTVFYGGRMGPVKRVDELTEIADIAFSFGRDIDIVVCTGSMSIRRSAMFRERFPQVELHTGTDQEATWRIMAECHVGFMWSRHEMIGSMFVEQMAAGMPIIAHPHRWLEALLPEEYPYWAGDAKVAGAQLRLLYEAWQADPDGYAAPMAEWGQYVRERYDSVVAGQRFRGIVEQRLAKHRRGLDDVLGKADDEGQAAALVQIIDEVLHEGMTFPELVKAAQKGGQMKHIIGKRLSHARSNATIRAFHVARHLGWRPDGPGPDFTFTKEKQDD